MVPLVPEEEDEKCCGFHVKEVGQQACDAHVELEQNR